MSGKHTPGPWIYNGFTEWEDGHGWYVDLPTPLPRRVSVEGANAAEADANARLIAAAPEMLEACNAAFEWLGGVDGAVDIREKLLAAIMKAEGRE